MARNGARKHGAGMITAMAGRRYDAGTRALLIVAVGGFVACADAGPSPASAVSLAAPADGGGSMVDAEVAADAAIPGVTIVPMTAGGMTFDVRVAGPADGEVVILLHGFPETSYEWRSQLVALAAAGYRALAPDQRGYSPGARPTAVDQYTVTALAGDVVGIADAAGAKRFHLVGHDWGAGVGWGVAGLRPDRVLSYASLSVPHPDAFKQALADPSSCQHQDSSYFDCFVMPDAVNDFLANGDAQLGHLSRRPHARRRGLCAGARQCPRDDRGPRLVSSQHRGPAVHDAHPGPGHGAHDGRVERCGPLLLRRDPRRDRAVRVGALRARHAGWRQPRVPENAADQVNALLLKHLRAYPAR